MIASSELFVPRRQVRIAFPSGLARHLPRYQRMLMVTRIPKSLLGADISRDL